MKRRRVLVVVFLFFLVGLSLALAACDSGMDPSGTPAVEAVLSVPFTLPAGRTAVLTAERLSLTFLGVLDDSRCPVDVVCSQAGNATMSILAAQQGRAATTLTLTLNDDPQAVVYEGFGIHAQQLMPDPLSDRTIPPGNYRVTILVDRP